MSIEKLDSPFHIPSLFHKIAKEEGAAFLDSSSMGYDLGRFSILTCNPVKTFNATSSAAYFEYEGQKEHLKDDPLEILRNELRGIGASRDDRVPFQGGAIGYISYDFWRVLENRRLGDDPESAVPLMRFGIYDVALVVDHLEPNLYLVGSDRYPGSGERKARLLELARSSEVGEEQVSSFSAGPLESNFTESKYCETIDRVRDYIREGEVYQVNLSQSFASSFQGSPASLYAKLREVNPAPYSAYLDFGDEQVLSSSPERFMQLIDSRVETRPIKGTMPRGLNFEEEQKNSEALQASEKDKAELLMIVDLERNDLGKVCQPGSIRVEGLFDLEAYAKVLHQTARVIGDLEDPFDAFDCFRALFPGGSISGTPKIRAMEVIDELEPQRRGVYTGSIGYFGFDGNADFNIAIRTMRVANETLHFNVGGGIVWDSDPESEYKETLVKASALFEALGFDDHG